MLVLTLAGLTLVPSACAADPAKPARPGAAEGLLSACRLEGQIATDPDGHEHLKLQVKLEFRTDRDDTLVPIGFKGARFTQAALDGETPRWGPDADGFVLRVAKAKDYHLAELAVHVPIARNGADHKVLLEKLPRSAITTLDWLVPARPQVVRLPLNPFDPAPVELDLSEHVVGNSAVAKGIAALAVKPEAGGSRIQSDALGVVDRLEVSWTMGLAGTELAPAAAVVADISATVNERDRTVDTTGLVRVESKQGSVEQVVFQLAPDAMVSLVESEPKATALDWKFDAERRRLTIRLSQPLRPNQPPLTFRVSWEQKHSGRPGAMVSTGVLALLEPREAAESGTVTVWSRQRITFQRQGLRPTVPRERPPGTDPRLAGFAFAYARQPADLKVVLDPVGGELAAVEIRPQLHLSFAANRALVLRAEFELARVHRGEISQLEIHWPADWSLEPLAPQPGTTVSEPVDGVVRIHWDTPFSSAQTITLSGRRSIDGRTTVDLPRVVSAEGPRGRAIVHYQIGELRLQPMGMSVWAYGGSSSIGAGPSRPRTDSDGPLAGPTVWTLNPPGPRSGWQLTIGAQPRRHDVRVGAEAYVTPREIQVRQELAFRFVKDPPALVPPATMVIRVPAAVAARLEARLAIWKSGRRVEGVIGLRDRPGIPEANWVEKELVLPREPELQSGCELALTYRLPRPQGGPPDECSLPLIQISDAFALDGPADLRIWTTSTMAATLVTDAKTWRPAVVEPLRARTLLFRAGGTDPAIHLQADSLSAPVQLTLTSSESDRHRFVANRVLVEAGQPADGRISYRVRLHLSEIREDDLVLLLPGSVRSVDTVAVNGVMVPAAQVVRATDAASGRTRVAVALEPLLMSRTALVEVRFQTEIGNAWWHPAQTLPAPEVEGKCLVDQVRWRVAVPADWLPIGGSAALAAEDGYQWRALPWEGTQWLGYFGAPQPRIGDEVTDKWIRWGDPGVDGEAAGGAELTFVQSGAITPLRIFLLPRVVWILACSFAILAAGVRWCSNPPRRALVWLAVIVAGIVVIAALSPMTLPALLLGLQPGMAVLTLMLAVLWLRRFRWRRQIVLMPGFQRLAPGSVILGAVNPPAAMDQRSGRD